MKAITTIYCILFLLLFHVLTLSSVLSETAASLIPGTYAVMPANESMAQMDLHYSLLYWADGGVWNPVKKRVQFVGGPGTCCASTPRFKLITYDEATDVWTAENTPYITGGHSNDCNALDPNTGTHYFALFQDNKIKKYAGSSWSTLPARPGGETPSSGLDWFPDMNNSKGGLVCFGPNGKISWFNNGTWISIPGATYGNLHIISEYNPVHKLMWFGGGGSAMYKMDAQLKVTKLKNAPFYIGSGETWNMTDPVSGKHIVRREDPPEWWEYDIMTDNWTLIRRIMPPIHGSMFHVPIPEYGVILFFTHYNSARHTIVYKHKIFAAANDRRIAGKINSGFEVSVLPNPFRGNIAISCPALAGSAISKKTVPIKIFDINGKMVNKLTTDSRQLTAGITWNASPLPSGLYILKVNLADKILTKRLLLQK